MTSRTSTLLATTAGFVFIIATQQAMAQQLNVTAAVVASCTVDTNATLAFGNYDFNAGNQADDTFDISCTAPTSADVLLDGGGAENGGGLRLMQSGAERLGYQLFTDTAGGTPWTTNAKTVQVDAADTPVPVSVFGQILAGQPVPSGSYSDTVQITVAVTS